MMFALLAALAAAAVGAYGLWRLLRSRKSEESPSPDGIDGGGGGGEDDQLQGGGPDRRSEEERQRLRKEALVRQLMGDQTTGQMMLQSAGMSKLEWVPSPDDHLVRKVADRIPDEALEVLNASSQYVDSTFSLERTSTRVPVAYPTSDIEPVLMTDIGQIAGVIPEQLIQPDVEFYRQLACGELMVMQSYENQLEIPLLYCLLDGSGSMDRMMGNGSPRHIWARGVMLKLLMKAVQGQARYYLRYFTDSVSRLYTATDAGGAEEVMLELLSHWTKDGGTRIAIAIRCAVKDILDNRTKETTRAEVLLLSDGEDERLSESDLELLEENSIKLHVIMIGSASNSLLQKYATTYRRI